jgi:hypothetical protein
LEANFPGRRGYLQRKAEMSEQDLRQLRAAQNQSLFREVNNRVVELNESREPPTESSMFVCECARIDCVEEIEMTLGEYERVRSNPRRFVVSPSDDHVLPDVERVVESTATYFVVEKVEIAARVAEKMAADGG